MDIDELRAELEDVQTCLRAIRRGAQSYSTSSRSVTKVDYQALLKERDKLLSDIAVLETGGQVLVGWPGR